MNWRHPSPLETSLFVVLAQQELVCLLWTTGNWVPCLPIMPPYCVWLQWYGICMYPQVIVDASLFFYVFLCIDVSTTLCTYQASHTLAPQATTRGHNSEAPRSFCPLRDLSSSEVFWKHSMRQLCFSLFQVCLKYAWPTFSEKKTKNHTASLVVATFLKSNVACWTSHKISIKHTPWNSHFWGVKH